MGKFKDYLKCVYANKGTLLGYLGVLTLPVTAFLPLQSPELKELSKLLYVAFGGIGFFCLLSTTAGFETFRTYKKTKDYIQKTKKFPNRLDNLISGIYCEKKELNWQ